MDTLSGGYAHADRRRHGGGGTLSGVIQNPCRKLSPTRRAGTLTLAGGWRLAAGQPWWRADIESGHHHCLPGRPEIWVVSNGYTGGEMRRTIAGEQPLSAI